MTKLEKWILKSLKGTAVIQCGKVKCNPKAGVLFTSITQPPLESCRREWFTQNDMKYWEPVARTGCAPSQGPLHFMLQGCLLPPGNTPDSGCCVGKLSVSTCSVQEGNKTWKGFTGVYRVLVWRYSTVPCWARHRVSCDEERGIQRVRDADIDFEDHQENGLSTWGGKDGKSGSLDKFG